MPANTEILRHERATPTAVLARPVGMDRDQLATSIFDFVGQHVAERSPSGVVNRLRQGAVNHVLDLEVFDGDQAVRVCEVKRELMQEVPALVGRVLLLVCDDPALFPPAVGAELPSAEDFLGLCELFLGLPIPAGVVDKRPVGRRQ